MKVDVMQQFELILETFVAFDALKCRFPSVQFFTMLLQVFEGFERTRARIAVQSEKLQNQTIIFGDINLTHSALGNVGFVIVILIGIILHWGQFHRFDLFICE